MHHRTGGKEYPARSVRADHLDGFVHVLRRRTKQASGIELRPPQVIVAPHHPLGHAGGAAGVDEQHVAGRTGYAQRRTVALRRQRLVRFGKRCDRPRIAYFYKDPGLA